MGFVCISFRDLFTTVFLALKNWCKRNSLARLLMSKKTRLKNLHFHEFFWPINFTNFSSFKNLIIFDKCSRHLPNTTLQIKLAKTITHPQPPSGGFSSSFDPQQSFLSRSVESEFKSILTFFSKLCLFCGSGDFSWSFADVVTSTEIMCYLFSLVF